MEKNTIVKIMQNSFQLRKNELESVKHNYETRAFAVAGIDLIYNYMKEVLEQIPDLPPTNLS